MEKRTIESESPVMANEGVLAAVITTVLVPAMNEDFCIEKALQKLEKKKTGIAIFVSKHFEMNYYDIKQNSFSGSTVNARSVRKNANIRNASAEISGISKEISLFEFFVVVASELHRGAGILGAHNVFYLKNNSGKLEEVIVIRKNKTIYIQGSGVPFLVYANDSRVFYRNTTLYQSN